MIEYILKYGRKGKCIAYFYYETLSINKTQKRNRRKLASFPSPKESDIQITKNCRGMILTIAAAKIYFDLLLNSIKSGIQRILVINQNDLREKKSTTSEFLTILKIIEEYVQKF